MNVWAGPALLGALLASALLLRRWPLAALAVTLGGAVVILALQQPRGTSTVVLVVVAIAAGLEICYTAATRTRRVSVTGAAMAGSRPLYVRGRRDTAARSATR